MLLYSGVTHWPKDYKKCAVTIGNFDGVHLGHQALLAHLVQAARAKDMPSVVIFFEPQPQEYFLKSAASSRITNLREKLYFIQQTQASIDAVLCLPFNPALATLSAEDFIQRVLLDALDARFILVGNDFRFGFERRGNVGTLREKMGERGAVVEGMGLVLADEIRISSTRVRQALQQGDLDAAAVLLGRQFSLLGKVVRGDQRGRLLGFPTANIPLKRLVSPIRGVFVVSVKNIRGDNFFGVANVGTRPTIDGLSKKTVLEIHLFDFSGDLYGQRLEIFFLRQLRQEKKFPNLMALQMQIQHDVQEARRYLRLEKLYP